jgi:hypothetical protein
MAMMSCGTVQPVRVLPQGQTELVAALGGPVLPQSSPTIVVPYLTLGAMHGVSEEVTLVGNFHALMAAFGVAGVDVGAAARVVKQNGAVPELTAKAQAYVFSNFKVTRLFPYLALNASYALGERGEHLVYGGVENVLQFSGSPTYFLNPLIGVQLGVSERVKLQAEGKWMAANVFTGNGIFEAQSSIGNTGSVAAYIGFSYVLGK